MTVLFNERGELVATDYYASEEFKARRPCCVVREGVWHLLLAERSPVLPDRTWGYAMPWQVRKEKAGWLWKIGVGHFSQLVPLPCFAAPAPELPGFGSESRGLLLIYGFLLPGLGDPPKETLGLAVGEAPQVLYRGTLKVVRITADLKGKILARQIARGEIGNYYK